MINLRARWYEPSTMRFSQRDIIRGFTLIPSTQNRYAYCLNNPILFTDPSGEFVLAALLIGAAIGAIIGGVSSYKAQKAATGKVDAWKVAKDALIGGVVGGVVGVVGAAVAGALATAVGATTLTATGLTTTLTLAQSVGVMSVSAVAAGTVARATNAAVRNSFTNEPKRDVAKEAFNPKAMTTDAVVGGISGVATYYSTGGVYSTTSIDRRYGGSTTPTSTKPTQGDKPNGSTSGDNPLDDAVRNASGEYAGEQANGAAQSENVGSKPCTGANPNGVKVSVGQQDKHIPGTNNFQQGVDNGLSRSILTESPQQLLDDFAGTGTSIGNNKEWVDFGKTIGQYFDTNLGTYVDTTKGIIHYNSSGGAHIVPSNPLGGR